MLNTSQINKNNVNLYYRIFINFLCLNIKFRLLIKQIVLLNIIQLKYDLSFAEFIYW